MRDEKLSTTSTIVITAFVTLFVLCGIIMLYNCVMICVLKCFAKEKKSGNVTHIRPK